MVAGASGTHPAGREIDLFAVLVRRWRVLLLLFIIGAAVGVGAVLVLPKTYRATAILAPASGEQGRGGIGGLIGQFAALSGAGSPFTLSGEPTADEYLSIATSRTFLEQFATELELVPVVFADEWDAEAKSWRDASADPPGAADVSRVFREEILEVRSDPDTRLVRLSVTWTNPAEAAAWANDLVRRLNESARSRAIRDAETGLRYLQSQLESTAQVPLKAAIGALMEAQLQKIMLARVREEYAFRVVDPAVVPELEDFVSPRPVVMAVFGGLGALILGGVAFLLLERLRLLRADG